MNTSIAPAGKGKSAADRIRETARKLFYREGIRAVGVDAIVQEAGVTKPSLYRAFSSKDELAATYLRDYEAEFWKRFETGLAAHPDDPRAQLMVFLDIVAQRIAQAPEYRGCGLSNAVVEYPDSQHPARRVAVAHKRVLHQRLQEMARGMGARDPQALGDALMLLLEGAFVSAQLFPDKDGPARSLAAAARQMIDASLANPP
ncbi:TetR/AcrR family transcriptional regulator [Bordetella genomosp. 12]|uniref:TetR family transcriptional regulator n=1 Tax=Bordetella genomosp. 12 TaxID=463035 RepID=A0A261VMP8_9BORD|nr:TetR/AcrR family transcriptional regulator [Bordetella genomosp. 12]OZI74483.1 TetR family transcriptional regulator [Bordetella genomosp. 12]